MSLRTPAALPLLALTAFAADDPARLASPSRSFHTGDQVTSNAYRPQAIAAADLDGDGDPDLALAHVGNFIEPSISVMRNAGDGTYEEAEVYTAKGETMGVVAEDLDGDGDVDLAYCQSAQGTSGSGALIYLNRGDGTFDPMKSYATGKGPTGIASADFDQDGDPDLATANWGFGEEDVSILYNDGAAGFGQRLDAPVTGEQPLKIAAGDLNGDTYPDLVATLRDGSPSLAVLLNDTAGGFRPPIFHTSSASYIHNAAVALGDLDKDGDLDVVYGGGSAGSGSALSVFWNPGNGQLGTPSSIGTSYAFGTLYDIELADVTGDTWLDVLGTAQSSKYGYVLLPSAGAGAFGTSQVYRTGEMARSVAAADVDGDGDGDVLVANNGSLTVTVHTNEGGFSMPPMVPIGGWIDGEMAAADVELDGDVDLVTLDANVWLLRNDGAGAFVAGSSPAGVTNLSHPELADVNGDLYPDLVALRGNELYVLANDQTGAFPSAQGHALGDSARDLALGDVDGDGDRDAIMTGYGSYSAPALLVSLNSGGSFGAPTKYSETSIVGPEHLVSGDFDGDGDLDVVTGHGGTIGCWLGNGDGSFAGVIATGLGNGGTLDMAAADFDGDGHLDVAGTGYGSSFAGENLVALFGYGDGDFSQPTLWHGLFSLQYGGARGLAVLDGDQDGDPDLLGGCYGADDVSLFLNNGDRTFQKGRRYGVDGNVLGVTTADFDGDGLEDVAVTHATEPPIGHAISFLFGLEVLPFDDIGFGLDGEHGIPALGSKGTLDAGQTILFDVSNAAELTTVIHAFGVTPLYLSFLGGELVPSPDYLASENTGADGTSLLSLTWPAGVAPGTEIYAQAWVIDPAGPEGFAATNALLGVQP